MPLPTPAPPARKQAPGKAVARPTKEAPPSRKPRNPTSPSPNPSVQAPRYTITYPRGQERPDLGFPSTGTLERERLIRQKQFRFAGTSRGGCLQRARPPAASSMLLPPLSAALRSASPALPKFDLVPRGTESSGFVRNAKSAQFDVSLFTAPPRHVGQKWTPKPQLMHHRILGRYIKCFGGAHLLPGGNCLS